MSDIECQECRAQFDGEALFCPHCGAANGAALRRRTGVEWFDEIQLLYRAQTYGEVGPLLDCLERQGLEQPLARRLVADLARQAKVRGGRNEALEKRDYSIAALVANRRGLRERQGDDPRRATSDVAEELQRRGLELIQGEPISRKAVDRACKTQMALLGPAIFEPFYRSGLDGLRILVGELDSGTGTKRPHP